MHLRTTSSLRRLTVIAFVLALAACKSGSGSDSDDDSIELNDPPDVADAPDPASTLEGTWDLCNEFNATSSRFTYVFEAQTYRLHYATFLTSDCSGEAETDNEMHGGSVELPNETVDETGVAAREINLHIELIMGGALPEADQYYLYNIVAGPTNNELFFGGSGEFTPETRPTALEFELPYVRRE